MTNKKDQEVILASVLPAAELKQDFDAWKASVENAKSESLALGEVPEITDEASAKAVRELAKKAKALITKSENLRKEVTSRFDAAKKEMMVQTAEGHRSNEAVLLACKSSLLAWEQKVRAEQEAENARIRAEQEERDRKAREQIALVDTERNRLTAIRDSYIQAVTKSEDPASLTIPRFHLSDKFKEANQGNADVLDASIEELSHFTQEVHDLLTAAAESGEAEKLEKARGTILERAGLYADKAKRDEVMRRQRLREEEEQKKMEEEQRLAEMEERKQMALSSKVKEITVTDLASIPVELYEIKFNLNSVKAYLKAHGKVPGAEVSFENNIILR